MQVIQIRVGNVLFQFKSVTRSGADFMQQKMFNGEATKEMIKSMVESKQIQIFQN